MAKFVTRLTVIIVSLYFLMAHILAFHFGIDILSNTYILLFELCVVCYTFLHGKYHCKYMKFTAISIFICDFVNHLDYYLNFLTVDELFYFSIVILALGVGTSTFKAVHHFYKVLDYKQKREKLYGSSGIATNNNN